MKTQLKTKKVMKTNVEKSVEDYLKNAEKHLFDSKYVWDENYAGNYYKVIPIMLNNNLHYVSIAFNSNGVRVDIKDTSWVKTKNHLGMMKNEVFPQYKKHKSIKKVKEFQEKFDKVKQFAESNSEMEISKLKLEIEKIMK